MLKIYAFFTRCPAKETVFAAFMAVIVILASTLAAYAEVQPKAGKYSYNILREGKQIGRYSFDVKLDGTTMTINAQMDVEAKVLFLTAYEAHHTRTEIYENGVLKTVEGQANYNGKTYEYTFNTETGSGARNGQAFTLDLPVLMLSPFAPKFEDTQYYSMNEKGRPYLATFKDMGTVKKKAGIKLKPYRYIKMGGEAERDLWFTPEGILHSLAYEKDGATISFKKLDD